MRVCSNFCSVMYEECADARVAARDFQTIGQLFSSGDAMCSGLGYSPVTAPASNSGSIPRGYFSRANVRARQRDGCFGVEPFHDVFSGAQRAAGVGMGAAAVAGALALWAGSRSDSSSANVDEDKDADGTVDCAVCGCTSRPRPVFGSGSGYVSAMLAWVVLACMFPLGVRGTFTAELAKSLGAALSSNLEAVADEQLRRPAIQAVYDAANYTTDVRDGAVLVASVRAGLGGFFQRKLLLVEQLATDVASTMASTAATNVAAQPAFYDEDTVLEMPGATFSEEYGLYVSFDHSTVKIPEFADRDPDSPAALKLPDGALAGAWATASIDEKLRVPQLVDSSVRWAYMGHRSGTFR